MITTARLKRVVRLEFEESPAASLWVSTRLAGHSPYRPILRCHLFILVRGCYIWATVWLQFQAGSNIKIAASRRLVVVLLCSSNINEYSLHSKL
jgi:hypothetical protein